MPSAPILMLGIFIFSFFAQAEYVIRKGKNGQVIPQNSGQPYRSSPTPPSVSPKSTPPAQNSSVPMQDYAQRAPASETYESQTMMAINSLYQWMKTSRIEPGDAGYLEHLINVQGALRTLTYNLKNCLSRRDTFLRTRYAQLGRFKPTSKAEDLNVQTIVRGLAHKTVLKREEMEKNVLYYGPRMLPALKDIVARSTDLEVLDRALGLHTLLTDGEVEQCIDKEVLDAKTFFFQYALPKEQVKACRVS